MKDTYDIHGILRYAATHAPLLAVDSREEWVRLCHCLKILGYPEELYLALSIPDEEAQRAARRVWSVEKHPWTYVECVDKAKAAIVGMMKKAKGIEFLKKHFRKEADGTTERSIPASAEVTTIPMATPPQPPVGYVGSYNVVAMEGQLNMSSLFHFLCSRYPQERVEAVCKQYRVGYHFSGGLGYISFPLINEEQKIVDVQLIPYKDNGHRNKDVAKPVSYYLPLTYDYRNRKISRAPWCLFGAHLLSCSVPNETPVCIVESPKTALIAKMEFPQCAWLATCGQTNLKAERLQAWKEFQLYIFPDMDGIEDWRSKVEELRKEGFKVKFVEEYRLGYKAGDKDDLGDVLLRRREKELSTDATAKI